MVQKQAANSIRSHSDGFADDDPLAELARIVGFDQPLKREPVVSLPQAPQMGSAEFNLEDELMREFEGYESAPAPSSYVPPLSVPEPVVPRPMPVESYQAPQYREEPSFEAEPPVYLAPEVAYQSEPVEFSASDAPYADAYAPVFDQPVVQPEVSLTEPEVHVEHRVEPEVSLDLADELEFAVADADIRPEPVMAPSRPLQPEPPRLRLPLANFSAQPVRRAEPQFVPEPPQANADVDLTGFDAPAVQSAVTPAAPSLDFGKATFDWASGPVEPIPAAAQPIAVAAPVPTPHAASQFAGFSIDAEPRPNPVVVTEPASRIEREEPDFSFDFLDELAAEDEPQIARKEPEPVAAQAAPAASDEEFDPFADQDFDLQLDDIEIDLTELDVAPQKVQPAPAAAPAISVPPAPVFAAAAAPAAPARTDAAGTEPVRVESVRPEQAFGSVFAGSASPAPAFAQPALSPLVTAAAPSVGRPTETYAAAPVSPAAPVRPAAPVEDDSGFDPSEISEQDEYLETLSGMDVPEVPVADASPAQSVPPDYDLDIDAELATLFEEPVAPPQPTPIPASRIAPASATAAATSRAPLPPLDDFDAFEKALEEDFRSTMTSTGALEPESRGHITIAGEGRGFRFRHIKPYLMAGTAVVVLLAGAGGLYSWLGSGAVGTLTGGEPQVIAADKSPVKIVPENPGGKSVPNQDKAVYDRVAGNGVEDPKQPSLISSEEEPVDVVQRTLIPETLPMEGENEAMATPVGETEDPRLLPDGQPQEAAAEDPATITPRKVRTMIVRPDGTLIAQEVPAEPAPAAMETSARTPSEAPAEAPVLAPPSVPNPSTSDAVNTVDTRVVTPGGASEQAAAPVTAPAASATAATEVAAAAPATPEVQTVAEAAAATATPPAADPTAARAPIPTTRPADQPVNVVGTVTDQGNVRPAQPAATAPAQPAEVAAASPSAATQAPAAPAGSFGIQIASLPSEADAQKSYRNLSSKFGGVLGGKPWEIRQADVPGKGTFYRVRIIAGSKADAVALCEQYRSAGGSCIVSR